MELSRLAPALAGSPALARRARLAGLSFVLKRGGDATTVTVGNGVAVAAGAAPAASFTLVATPDAWKAYAEALPPVGYQSLVGMQRPLISCQRAGAGGHVWPGSRNGIW